LGEDTTGSRIGVETTKPADSLRVGGLQIALSLMKGQTLPNESLARHALVRLLGKTLGK
jgi:hypothetical protein